MADDPTDVTLADGTKVRLRQPTAEEAAGKPAWELVDGPDGKPTLRRMN
jgi:hypothetical protein